MVYLFNQSVATDKFIINRKMGVITGVFLLAIMGAGGAYYYKTQVMSNNNKEANADAADSGGDGGWFGFGGKKVTDEETGEGGDGTSGTKKKTEEKGWFSDFKLPDQNGLQMMAMKNSISNAFK